MNHPFEKIQGSSVTPDSREAKKIRNSSRQDQFFLFLLSLSYRDRVRVESHSFFLVYRSADTERGAGS
jgi:hypothetical protein